MKFVRPTFIITSQRVLLSISRHVRSTREMSFVKILGRLECRLGDAVKVDLRQGREDVIADNGDQW